MTEPDVRPLSPWELLHLAETYDANGDRATAAMLLDCAFAAFSASASIWEMTNHTSVIDDIDC
jgi:hypothetical protein